MMKLILFIVRVQSKQLYRTAAKQFRTFAHQFIIVSLLKVTGASRTTAARKNCHTLFRRLQAIQPAVHEITVTE